MNSLKSYQDQCYNIGSPSPSPARAPLSKLPKKLDIEFEFSPSKISPEISTPKIKPNKSRIPSLAPAPPSVAPPPSRKRKNIEVNKETPSSNKKPKMASKEEIMEMFAQQNKAYSEGLVNAVKVAVGDLGINTRMDGFAKQLIDLTDNNAKSNSAVQAQMTVVQEQMSVIQSSVDDNRIRFEEKLVTMEGQFNKFQENVLKNTVNKDELVEVARPMIEEEFVPKIKEAVKKELLSPIKASWNAMQSEKVFEHEHSMLVFGFGAAGKPIDAANDFLKNQMKVSEDTLLTISVKQAFKFGKDTAGKAAPLMIKFGHPSERNLILTHSKNITNKSIKVKKHIPKNYQAQVKVFEEEQYKLKNMPDMEYKTQIIFDGHLLVLRFRTDNTVDDKFHWTTYDSWAPPMDSKSDLKTSLKTPIGSKATPAPAASVTEKSNRAFLMSVRELSEQLTEERFKQELEKYLSEEHAKMVSEIRLTKRKDLFTVYCDSWKSAKIITSSYNKSFLNHEVSFTMFSKEDPSLKTNSE